MILPRKAPKPEVSLSAMDAIYHRRAVRNYTSEVIDKKTIRALLDAAVHAPTAMHEEPWAFAVVQDKSFLNRLSDSAKELLREEAQASGSLQAKHILDLVNKPDFNIFYNAGTLIVIASKIQGMSAMADCWLAAENLMLAACAKNLGTCVIGLAIGALNTLGWKAELKIPTGATVLAPIIVGAPAGKTPPTARKQPDILIWK